MQTSFLQSDDWGRFQTAVGHPAIKHNEYQFFETAIPFGKYLYCPQPNIQSAEQFIENATALAGRERAWFIRVEPNYGSARIMNHELGIKGLKSSIINHQSRIKGSQSPIINHESRIGIVPTMPLQPGRTLHVPLADDQTMLAAMHPKTRYNIRVAEKAGVRINFSQSPDAVEAFIRLLEKTRDRAGIRLHPRLYYQTMLRLLGKNHESGIMNYGSISTLNSQLSTHLSVEIVLAEHDGVNVAGALIGYWGDTAIYLHGGSNYERRSVMAPHLLHWTVMRHARDAGFKVYDLGGIAPEEKQESGSKNQGAEITNHESPITNHLPHPWSGITRFKRGFGGAPIDYPPAVDVVLRPTLYSIYNVVRKIRRSV